MASILDSSHGKQMKRLDEGIFHCKDYINGGIFYCISLLYVFLHAGQHYCHFGPYPNVNADLVCFFRLKSYRKKRYDDLHAFLFEKWPKNTHSKAVNDAT